MLHSGVVLTQYKKHDTGIHLRENHSKDYGSVSEKMGPSVASTMYAIDIMTTITAIFNWSTKIRNATI